MAYTPRSGDYHGQTFRSEYAYRNQLAQDRGFRSYWELRKYHGGKVHDVTVGFWHDEPVKGTYNFYLQEWLANLDHRPKPWERAKFDILYNAAKKEGWSKDPQGSLAKFLDYIGIRPLEKYRGIAVGDTPKA
jgi:hypothetical protein